jgi:predicted RNA-binding Zn ribbon-like protein
VVFAHDTELSLQAAAELVNADDLTSVAALDGFYRRWEYTGRHERTEAELSAVLALRPGLRELLLADAEAAAERINAVLASARAVPRLVRHEPIGWHVHAEPLDAPLATRIAVETAMAMIDVIRAGELGRLAVCADAGCDGVVLDLSRNRSRRFCSAACGNRQAVAAYRARARDRA